MLVGKLKGRTNSQQPFSLKTSPVKRLFEKNNETVEEMLVRKFKAKYIDNNPAFAQFELPVQASPRAGPGVFNKYASLKQKKNVFDVKNTSGSQWSQTSAKR